MVWSGTGVAPDYTKWGKYDLRKEIEASRILKQKTKM